MKNVLYLVAVILTAFTVLLAYTGICDMRGQADYSWVRAIADLGLVGCTYLVEISLAACVCYATVLSNYANDLRLADRAYEDYIQNLKK